MDKASKPLVLFAHPVSVQGFVYPRSSTLAMDQKHIIKGSLEDTSELRRVEKSCDWEGEGKRGDCIWMSCQLGSEITGMVVVSGCEDSTGVERK